MLPHDCLAREKRAHHEEVHHRTDMSMSSSVSETEEWVCAKLVHLNGTVTR